MKNGVPRSARAVIAVWVGVTALLWTAGCATTDPDTESELPWNRQQAWEGQLLMPGTMMPERY